MNIDKSTFQDLQLWGLERPNATWKYEIKMLFDNRSYRSCRQKASLFRTSRPRSGGLIHQVVDLEKLTYQCASPVTIRVIPLEIQFVHRRHVAAMPAPRLGTVFLLKSVLITERLSTAVEKALGPIRTLRTPSATSAPSVLATPILSSYPPLHGSRSPYYKLRNFNTMVLSLIHI